MNIKRDPRWDFVSSSPDVCGGKLVFAGSRVSIERLWYHLAGGKNLDDFVEGHPTVSREQAADIIELAGECLVSSGPPSSKCQVCGRPKSPKTQGVTPQNELGGPLGF